MTTVGDPAHFIVNFNKEMIYFGLHWAMIINHMVLQEFNHKENNNFILVALNNAYFSK